MPKAQRVLLDDPDDQPETGPANGHGPRLAEPADELRFPREVLKQRHDHKYRKRRRVTGTHSRAIDRGGLSWAIHANSRAGRFLIAYEDMLTQHLGRLPSVVEKLLITRAARVALHLELLDHQALAEGVALSTSDHGRYCAWSNSLSRLLIRLGLGPGKTDAPRDELADWVRDRGKRYNHDRKVP